jgi:hypothetical protein
LRKRFSMLFRELLKKQLLLKNIITEDDWETWSNDIIFEFARDNHFSELKDAEMLREKLQSLDQVQNYVGEYFSKEWVMKNILKFDDDEISLMTKQINKEMPENDEVEAHNTEVNDQIQADRDAAAADREAKAAKSAQ